MRFLLVVFFGLSTLLSTQRGLATEERDPISGGRIVLCGAFSPAESGWKIDTGEAAGKVSLSLKPGLQPAVAGGCVAGPALPTLSPSGSAFTVTHLRLLRPGEMSVKDVQAFTGAVRVCGSVIDDFPLLAIRFGTAPDQVVAIPYSPEAAKFKKGPRLSGPWCAYGPRLPELGPAGELIFPATEFHSDWNRSGFSVGN